MAFNLQAGGRFDFIAGVCMRCKMCARHLRTVAIRDALL
jgi:hypothetical protein